MVSCCVANPPYETVYDIRANFGLNTRAISLNCAFGNVTHRTTEVQRMSLVDLALSNSHPTDVEFWS